MFGLDWFVVVVVWSGVGNISFSCENGLVLIWFGFVPICRLIHIVLLSLAARSSLHSKLNIDHFVYL